MYLAMRASMSAIALFSRRRYQLPELVRTLHTAPSGGKTGLGVYFHLDSLLLARQVGPHLLGMLWPVVLSTTVDFTWWGFACEERLGEAAERLVTCTGRVPRRNSMRLGLPSSTHLFYEMVTLFVCKQIVVPAPKYHGLSKMQLQVASQRRSSELYLWRTQKLWASS